MKRGNFWRYGSLCAVLVVACGGAEKRAREQTAPTVEVRAQEVRSSPSPSQGLSGRTIALIDPGPPPRQRLRYRFAAPKREWLVVDDDIALTDTIEGRKPVTVHVPATTTRFLFDEKRVLASGELEYEGRIDSVDVSARMPSLRNKVRELTTPLVGLRFSGVVDARGFNRDANIERPKIAVSPATQQYVDRVRRSLLDVGFALPEEEVGVGARWRIDQPTDQLGMQAVRTTEWTLRSIANDAITVDATVTERFAGGTSSFRLPDYPEVTCTVTGFSASGTEQMTIPLDGLVSRGTSHWIAKAELTLEGPERSVRVHRSTEVDVVVGVEQ